MVDPLMKGASLGSGAHLHYTVYLALKFLLSLVKYLKG